MSDKPNPTSAPTPTRTTLHLLERMSRDARPFACMTCYDATTARHLALGGVHLLLVGDTAAEVILGLPRTIDMPLDLLVALTAAVKRGAPETVVMADMPFMSYQADDAEAIRNAGRFLTEGLADIVKVEADASFSTLVERMTRAGIPICGHIGSRPQQAALTGGYSSAGRTAEHAERIINDAIMLERAGCRMLLVEAVPAEVTDAILAVTQVPVIGIGAGSACHGQVIVLQDIAGLSTHPPRFAEPLADFGRSFQDLASAWADRVARRAVGGKPYQMKPGESDRFHGGTNIDSHAGRDGFGIGKRPMIG